MLNAISATGTGFKVVYSKGVLPATVSDYTPYVDQWMAANNGKAPQVIECLLTTQCVNAWQALKAVGFTGIFYDNLGGIAALQKNMAGTVTANFYNSTPNAGLTQMQNSMNAISPNTQLVGYSNVPGYFGASMFVQAVKKVGNNDTPQAVQSAPGDPNMADPRIGGTDQISRVHRHSDTGLPRVVAGQPGGDWLYLVGPVLVLVQVVQGLSGHHLGRGDQWS